MWSEGLFRSGACDTILVAMDVSFSLTPELLGFINAQVASGRDASAEVAALRQAGEEGLASGDGEALDVVEMRQAAAEELAASRKG